MDQNFLFRWIWRFNAVAIAIFLVLLGWGFLPYYYMFSVRPTIETIGGSGQPKPQQTNLHLFLDFTREGRREIVFALAPEMTVPEKFSVPDAARLGADTADMRRVANYLYMDPATGAARWLFPTNDQVITATDYVTKNISNAGAALLRSTEPNPILVVAYDVKPLGRAGAPASEARYQAYLSKLDGTNLTKVLDDLDEPVTLVPAAENTIFVTYKLKDRHMVATISLTDFKVLMTKDLSEYAQK